MSTGLDRRLAGARSVADAVLYEGYVLYPYRASAGKNQTRWQWGVVAPAAHVVGDPSESASLTSQFLVDCRAGASLDLRVRCLHVQARRVEVARDATWAFVASLEHGGGLLTSFDEAVEVSHDVTGVRLPGPTQEECSWHLPADRIVEELDPATRVVRERAGIDATIAVLAEPVVGPYRLSTITVTVTNTTAWRGAVAGHDEVSRHSLVATHLLAAAEQARFVSLLDPPRFAEAAAASCRSQGSHPVLVDDVLLSAPIVLYDHPAVAPESAGDMFDATEIDEILALRVLTLTDEEKREARGTDARAAAIIDRVEAMGTEAFSSLHGTFRELRSPGTTPAAPQRGTAPGDDPEERPWWDPSVDASYDPFSDIVDIGGVAVGAGQRVVLRPGRRADAQDAFFDGRAAEVAGVFHEVDGGVYLAVTIHDGDEHHVGGPAAHGRFLYFHPDEVEVRTG